MHFHVIGLDELPEPIRRMLAERGDDKDIRQIKHEITKRQEAAFWEGLGFDQMMWVARVLASIEQSEEPAQVAARHLGVAEAYMAMRFKSCACGEIHRDPDDFMKDLVGKTRELTTEERLMKELDLARIPHSPFVDPEDHGKFHCKKCNTIFATIADREKDAIGATHSGCVDSSD